MTLTAAEIAGKLGGKLEGDGSARISGLAGLREAGEGDLSFLANPKYASAVAVTRASAVLVNDDWDGECPCTVIRVESADEAFAAVVPLLAPVPIEPERGIHRTAVVADNVNVGADVGIGPFSVIEPDATIGARTVIGAGCYIGHGSVIGEDCRLYPNVSVREHTRMGDRTVVHSGAVIGSDGFGYVRDGDAWRKIPQVGVVEIGSDVEIGANVTIDRARFGRTVIGDGVKIDNLVQVAHNVRVDDHTAMAAQVGISGSTVIGKGVQIGGQAGLAGHLVVGDGAVVGGGAGVTKDVEAGSFVSDYPAMPHRKARRVHASVMRLPQLRQKVAELERRLADVARRLEDTDGLQGSSRSARQPGS